MSYTIFVEGKNCTVKLEWDDIGVLRIYHRPKDVSLVVPSIENKKGFISFVKGISDSKRSKNIKAKDFEDLDVQLTKAENRCNNAHDYW